MSELPSKTVVARMSLYLRQLERAVVEERRTISSRALSNLMGISDSLVRKDLARLDTVGHPGVGFECEDLIRSIRNFLGMNQDWPIVVVGCGNLGQALLGYRGFAARGFRIVAAFDVSPKTVGRRLQGLVVSDIADFKREIAQKKVELAALCVPADQAQATAEGLVRDGIRGILNFAPVMLNLPSIVSVSNVDLTIEMEQLVFAVVRQPEIGL